MKNLIFVTVFYKNQALDLLYLFLESLFIFGHIDERINLLIYTSPEFKQQIKDSNLYAPEFMIFHTNTSINDVASACKARLDLFEIPNVLSYDKILYLDVDILITGPISNVFDLIQESDVLYTLEEGHTNREYWGAQLFQENNIEKPPRTAFTSGIMGFKVSPKIQLFFKNVKDHLQRDNRKFSCHDQHFIVYHAFLMDIYDNQVFKKVAKNNPKTTDNSFVIVHYPGGPGKFDNKLTMMKNGLIMLKQTMIESREMEAKKIINERLLPIIQGVGEPLEGNIFMLHREMTYTDIYKEKRQNIVSLFSLKTKSCSKALEIGFNAGFSALLMLLSNPNMTLICADLCEHRYTVPCFQVLKEIFGCRIELIQGSSIDTLSTLFETFDIIHIDGGHMDLVVKNDCDHAIRLSTKGSVLIMDDYEFPNIQCIWDDYCCNYNLLKPSSHIFETKRQDTRIVPILN